ncbi:Hypothetical protein CINCED_3A018083 [Cinara cedri]|uniref:Uncharacterized protein n=1 Tax=Cinara cedri TaxID=506608 RepID=A0A5E4MLN5_9HEMI|nr:Hypothetical protein CINCED_3A018083 [Cinara cedri]
MLPSCFGLGNVFDHCMRLEIASNTSLKLPLMPPPVIASEYSVFRIANVCLAVYAHRVFPIPEPMEIMSMSSGKLSL